jgi:hypothetical protein
VPQIMHPKLRHAGELASPVPAAIHTAKRLMGALVGKDVSPCFLRGTRLNSAIAVSLKGT